MEVLPDVIGFTLNEAVEKCKALGYEIDIVFTRPSKASPAGKPRVVRFKRVSQYRGVITVTFENDLKGGG